MDQHGWESQNRIRNIEILNNRNGNELNTYQEGRKIDGAKSE